MNIIPSGLVLNDFRFLCMAARASQSGKTNASSIRIKHERYSNWLGGTSSSFHFVYAAGRLQAPRSPVK